MIPAREQLLEETCAVLRGPCGVPGEISEASLLTEELRLDSVGMLSLAVNLENRFKVRLPDQPEMPPQTVGDVVDLLESSLRGLP